MAESSQHRRGDSFHVNWTALDMPRMAQEIYDETIAVVHLSLFGYWICEKVEHYEMAKTHIRELALDQGYKVDRIQNLKMRKLLQDTYSARPEIPKAEDDDDVDSEGERPSSSATPRRTDSQWLKDTLQNWENRRSRGPMREKSLDEILNKRSPSTPSGGVNGDKRRSASSPLIARMDTLPGSLRAHRQRILDEAARAILMDVPGSPTSRYPPNTPDRPAPLSLKSSSSSSPSAGGTPTTKRVQSPLTTSAMESFNLLDSLDTGTNFSEVIRRSITSPRAKYRFASPSPSSRSALQQSTDSSYQIVDEADGDVFGIAGKQSAQSDTASEITSILHEPRGRLSTIYETASTRDRYSLRGVNRLSDADWQTEVSVEEQEDVLRQDYENFLIDAHEDTDGDFGLDTEDIRAGYTLDPEDESDNENEGSPFDTPFDSLSTYVGSTEDGSVLETASNTSEQDASNSSQVQYSYASPSGNSLTTHSNHSTAAVDYYSPLPLRHYDTQGQHVPDTSIHPAFRKGYSAQHLLTPPAPKAFTPDSAAIYSFFETYFKDTLSRPPRTASHPAPPPPSEATTSPPGPPPPLPTRSPQRRNTTKAAHSAPVPKARTAPNLSAEPETPVSHNAPNDKNPHSEPDNTNPPAPAYTPIPSPSVTPAHRSPRHLTPPPDPIPTPYMTALLAQTRAQASTRGPVDWASLSPFERTWRAVNRGVLEQVFGRFDVELTEEDVELVEGMVGR